jgi:hypothetical protein
VTPWGVAFGCELILYAVISFGFKVLLVLCIALTKICLQFKKKKKVLQIKYKGPKCYKYKK